VKQSLIAMNISLRAHLAESGTQLFLGEILEHLLIGRFEEQLLDCV
jgi:hypothetical protein